MGSAWLAVLGVLLCVVVILTFTAFAQRRRLRRAPGAFRCRVRVAAGNAHGFRPGWSRPAWAYWVHDVLLVYRGPARVRVTPLPVRSVDGRLADVRQLGRLGIGPVSASLTLDDGALLTVAAPSAASVLLVGPFLAAAADASLRSSP